MKSITGIVLSIATLVTINGCSEKPKSTEEASIKAEEISSKRKCYTKHCCSQ